MLAHSQCFFRGLEPSQPGKKLYIWVITHKKHCSFMQDSSGLMRGSISLTRKIRKFLVRGEIVQKQEPSSWLMEDWYFIESRHTLLFLFFPLNHHFHNCICFYLPLLCLEKNHKRLSNRPSPNLLSASWPSNSFW